MRSTHFIRSVVRLVLALLIILLMSGFAPGPASPSGPAGSVEVSPEVLSTMAGAVLSLLMSYVPGLRTKFAALIPEVKRLWMLGLLAGVTGAIAGLSCAGVLAGVTCTEVGLWQLLWMFILALIGNQAMFEITPQPTDVRAAASAAKTDEHTVQSWG